MKQITMREFAILCRRDPDLYEQTVAIPDTITPDKVLGLAERNGYRIVPERSIPPDDQFELLDEEVLDLISGGNGALTQQEKLDALHTWIYYVMGFGEEQLR